MQQLKRMTDDQVMKDIRYIIFVRFSFLEILLGLFFTAANIYNHRPLSNIGMGLLGSTVAAMAFFTANDESNYLFSRLTFMILTSLVFIPIAYLTSPGSESAVLYVFLLIIFMLAVTAVHPWEYLFSLLALIETLILLRTEIWFPELYVADRAMYVDVTYRINDISLNYTIVALAVLFVLIFMMRYYTKHNDQLYKIGITDALTGLYNRLYFFEQAEKEVSRSNRDHNPYAIVFIDLNYFKRINDTLGHLVGDQVLKDIGAILQKNARKYDVAARYGGDEYIILLPNTSLEDANLYVERINHMFHDYIKPYEAYEFSVGIGVASSQGRTLEETIALADSHLYQNKSETKNEGE